MFLPIQCDGGWATFSDEWYVWYCTTPWAPRFGEKAANDG